MLQPGTRLGPYVVHELLGKGGMGEVYRGHDARLKRDVALKLLPRTVADDPDRLLRFEREARILASLNDPHIAGIYGLEEAGGTPALVMELVEGPTLADRLAAGALPLDEALDVALQIASALESAHEAGVVHRDLKPANVKVRPDGTVKVLDFGLAKAIDASGARASGAGGATVTSPPDTHAGLILGTAAYMAPEQARGRSVDRRADIWAFGCVLYEMLCGAPAFKGETITDLLAAVVTSEPDWSAIPAGAPSRIRRLLLRCLQKDPKSRLRDIGDARLELEAREADSGVAQDRPVDPAPTHGRGRATWLAAALGGLAVILALVLATTRYAGTMSAPQLPLHLSVTFPDNAQMHLGFPRPSLSISPDGRQIVYTAAGGPEPPQLWIRTLDRFDATPVAGTRGARMATFSPDGRWIAFFADGKLKKIPAATGPPVVLCDAPAGFGATWTSDDEIVFAEAPGGDRRPDVVPGLPAGR